MFRKFTLILLIALPLLLIAAVIVKTLQSRRTALAELPEYHEETIPKNQQWYREELVEIVGYQDHVMELGISQDGRFLLFNDRSEPNKDMHWAERISDLRYQYRGRLAETVSPVVDGTPSFDAKGNVYFTTLQAFPEDRRTIYRGTFRNGMLLDITPVDGDIYIQDKLDPPYFWVSLDPDVTDDGRLMVYSEGRFRMGSIIPYPFKIRGAQRTGGQFKKIDDAIFASVNSQHLDYAPAISADGLELFYSRIAKIDGKPSFLGIYTAKRSSPDEPFGPPERIYAITGEVEAPVLSGDERFLYYHRMKDGRFQAYRVSRRGLAVGASQTDK